MGSYIKQRTPVEGEEIMGLEKFGYVMFPDSTTTIEIPYVNGRHKLGNYSGKDATKFGLTQKQQQEFEEFFGIQFESPEGLKFLSEYQISISHLTNPFDEADTKQRFEMNILKANDGMGLIDVNTTQDITRYPFVLVDEVQEMEVKTNRNVVRNQALVKLEKLSEDKKKIVRVAKYLFNSLDITPEQAYNQLNDFIMAKFENADKFTHALSLNDEWLDTYITVKDAIHSGIIRRQEDGWYVNNANQEKLGKTVEEITKYLEHPDNITTLGSGSKNDQPYSIKAQLKHKLN